MLLALLVGLHLADKHSAEPRQTAHALAENGDILHQHWVMPGAELQSDGLHVTYTDQKIVEQNATGGQPNPPINLGGTHLLVTGDFSVSATMQTMPGAALQLYGQVPLVSDEFRVERPSIRFTIANDHTLAVAMWDGSPAHDLANPAPTLTQAFTFTPGDNLKLTMQRQNGQLAIVLNGKTAGEISEHGVFSSGQVWFGADSEQPGATWVLSHLAATKLSSSTSIQTLDGADIRVAASPQGLQTLATAKRPGFLVGTALAPAPLYSDATYQKTFFGNFGMFTPENALKRQFIEPQPGQYHFAPMDALIALAKQNDITHINGHALIFGEANPAYLTNMATNTFAARQAVEQNMDNYISTVVGHFKGRITSWDVVNEPLADYDTFDETSGHIYRDHTYYHAMGESYIAEALRTAHAADPNAALYINEYGLEQNGPRWDTMLALVTSLKQQGAPLTGIGFQAHEYEASDKIDTNVLKAHFKQLAALGLNARISEMDVYDDDGQQVQATQYSAVLDACISDRTCVSYTTWGFDNEYDLWQDDNRQLQYGKTLLWDGDKPTPAVAAMRAALQK